MSFNPDQLARLERVYASLGVWTRRYTPTTRLLARRLEGYGMSPEASRARLWRDVVSYARWCVREMASPGAAFCEGVRCMPSQPAPGSQHATQMQKDETERQRAQPLDWQQQNPGVQPMNFEDFGL